MKPLGPRDPKKIGPFTLISRLGSGGMGIVYLATKGSQRVALKVIHDALLGDESNIARFQREISALSEVAHPNIARVLEIGIDEDIPWFAIEFANGPNLTEIIEDKGPFDERSWWKLAIGLASGLQGIHSHGIIHRDIKPGNVILSDLGPKIIDFGIATFSDATSLTATGLVSGSPAWFSPEQLEGKPLTSATDIFSAGALLTYAATGFSPWGKESTTTSSILKILREEPNFDSLSENQQTVLKKMMIKNPTHRPSAKEILELISQLESGESVDAVDSNHHQDYYSDISSNSPIKLKMNSSSSLTKRRAQLAFLVATALVLGGLGAFTVVSNSNSGEPSANTLMSDENTSTGPAAYIGPALKIGSLLPNTGALSFLGPAMYAGVDLAVDEINSNGGVLGKPVQHIFGDSGDTSTNRAQATVDSHLSVGVGAIVGAASSGVSFMVIDKIIASGVVHISPANTSTDFTTYSDAGLYFRTAPSDTFQGASLGQLAAKEGARRLTILYMDDAYGNGLAKYAANSFDGISNLIPYDPFMVNFNYQVRRVKSTNPDAIALIGFEETTSIIEELLRQGIGPNRTKLYLVDGNLSSIAYRNLPSGAMVGVKGTLPGAFPNAAFQGRLLAIDSALNDFSYAAESYDAVMLIALAAEAAGATDGRSIAANLEGVSKGGTKCQTWKTCKALLDEGQDIDFDGASGPIEFDGNGEVSVARMGVYEYVSNSNFVARPNEFIQGKVPKLIP